jgi:hypothetical protein
MNLIELLATMPKRFSVADLRIAAKVCGVELPKPLKAAVIEAGYYYNDRRFHLIERNSRHPWKDLPV